MTGLGLTIISIVCVVGIAVCIYNIVNACGVQIADQMNGPENDNTQGFTNDWQDCDCEHGPKTLAGVHTVYLTAGPKRICTDCFNSAPEWLREELERPPQ